MCIDFRRSRPSQQPISIKGVDVEVVRSYRYLGVHLDERLDWSVNTDIVYKKAQSRLYILRRLGSFRICQKLLLMFYQSVVASVLFYAVVCWGGSISKRDAGRLDRLFTHVTPLLRSLHWLPVVARIRFKTLMLAYKAKIGPAPPYLMAMVKSLAVPRALRASSTARLEPPPLRTHGRQASRLFSVLAPRWWNELPLGVRTAESLVVFKRRPKTHLFVMHLTQHHPDQDPNPSLPHVVVPAHSWVAVLSAELHQPLMLHFNDLFSSIGMSTGLGLPEAVMIVIQAYQYKKGAGRDFRVVWNGGEDGEHQAAEHQHEPIENMEKKRFRQRERETDGEREKGREKKTEEKREKEREGEKEGERGRERERERREDRGEEREGERGGERGTERRRERGREREGERERERDGEREKGRKRRQEKREKEREGEKEGERGKEREGEREKEREGEREKEREGERGRERRSERKREGERKSGRERRREREGQREREGVKGRERERGRERVEEKEGERRRESERESKLVTDFSFVVDSSKAIQDPTFSTDLGNLVLFYHFSIDLQSFKDQGDVGEQALNSPGSLDLF
ncbi:hypothetical protein NFI96_006934 [Prochilodus magdalenae]|nr:hypothetical protein NFI96_006934 [Prochilodus magdalenae]